jgi:uncharacterized protein YndB with AHSA1/START domain
MKWQRIALYAAVVLGILGLLIGIAASRSTGIATYTASVTIARPPAVVFPWLYEPAKRKQWFGGLQETSLKGPAAPAVGTQIIDVVEQDGERSEMVIEVTAMEPDRRLDIKMANEIFEMSGRYDLKAQDGGTVLQFQGESTFKTWLSRLLAGTIQASAQRKLDQDMQKLKAAVEKTP